MVHPYHTGLQQSSDIPASDAAPCAPKQQKLIRQVPRRLFNLGVQAVQRSAAKGASVMSSCLSRPFTSHPVLVPTVSDPCPCIVTSLPLNSANSWTLDSAN
jgi:hypothetical protein